MFRLRCSGRSRRICILNLTVLKLFSPSAAEMICDQFRIVMLCQKNCRKYIIDHKEIQICLHSTVYFSFFRRNICIINLICKVYCKLFGCRLFIRSILRIFCHLTEIMSMILYKSLHIYFIRSLLQLFHHRLHICKYFFYMIKHIVPPLR